MSQPEISFDFGLAVRKANLTTNYGNPEIAERACITRGYLSHCINGHREPSLQVIGQIAGVWGLTYSAFFKGGEQQEGGTDDK